jgi:hypothetical protein
MMENAANVATAPASNPFYVAAEKRKVSNSNIQRPDIWHL